MKNSGIRHRVVSILILLVMSTPFLVGRPLSSLETTTEADPLPLLYLEPSNITSNPGETFTVDIKIANVTDLYGWGLTVTWSSPPLHGRWLNVTEAEQGEFLKRGGQNTFWTTPKIDSDYGTIELGCTRLLSPTGETGNGTLATITFGVTQGGNCTLHVYDTTLKDSGTPPAPIIHTVQDAYFYTTVPLAYFTYSPSAELPPPYNRDPVVGETVTFNATQSYDPDGGNITSYFWDFGDGTNTTETDPITFHTYIKEGNYFATVNVTDDEEESWVSVKETMRVWIRDIAIIDVNVSPTKVRPDFPVNVDVTARNQGDKTETFNLTAYYDGNIANKTTGISLVGEGATTTLTLTWNTTGIPVGVYAIKAVAEIEFDYNLTNNELIDGEVTVASVNEYAFPVVVAGVTFEVIVETTSTTSNFAFNQTRKEISFDASGPEEMPSFCNVKIPKALLDGNFTVLIDGTPVVPDPIVTPIDSYHFVNFTFTHNLTTHCIRIRGTTVATPPVASFTVDPELPYVDETITFTATDSEDPDGEIFSYTWDFGDGTTRVYVKGVNLTDTATHNYAAPAIYNVNLTVADNDGWRSTATKSIKLFLVYNVAITNVTVSPTSTNIGESVSVNVTVLNDSPGVNVNLDATVYFDNTTLETQSVSSLAAGSTKIVSFIWNTTFLPEGTYMIKATALVTKYGTFSVFPDELNTDDNTFIDGDVTVQKWTSVLSISASPTSLTVNEDALLSGSISPRRAGVEVTILYRPSGSQTWNILTTVLTNETGEYSYRWTPDSAETYESKANWTGNESTLPDESDTITVTVNKISSTISISLSETSVAVGSSIKISGDISPAVADVEATIEYSRDGEPWTTLATVYTDSNGHYSYDWVPAEPGTYELKASWVGDAITVGDESDTRTLTVQQAPINILPYVGVGVGITAIIIAVLIYFLKRSK